MVEGASLDSIAHPELELERDALRELLVAGYVALLDKALELDPNAAKNWIGKHRRTRTGEG